VFPACLIPAQPAPLLPGQPPARPDGRAVPRGELGAAPRPRPAGVPLAGQTNSTVRRVFMDRLRSTLPRHCESGQGAGRSANTTLLKRAELQ